MTCPSYRPLVRRLAEGDLPSDQRGLLDDHLPECPACRRSVALLGRDDRTVAAALLEGPRTEPPPESFRRFVRITAAGLAILVFLLVALYVVYAFLEHRVPPR